TYQYGVRSMVERLVESGLYIRLRFRMVCRCLILEPPKSTLFPYTTLFRSRLWQDLSQDFDLNLFYSTRGHFTLAHTDAAMRTMRSEEHTSELQSRGHLVCRLLLEQKNAKSLLMPSHFFSTFS